MIAATTKVHFPIRFQIYGRIKSHPRKIHRPCVFPFQYKTLFQGLPSAMINLLAIDSYLPSYSNTLSLTHISSLWVGKFRCDLNRTKHRAQVEMVPVFFNVFFFDKQVTMCVLYVEHQWNSVLFRIQKQRAFFLTTLLFESKVMNRLRQFKYQNHDLPTCDNSKSLSVWLAGLTYQHYRNC